MDEKLKKEIEARVLGTGHSKMELTEKRWSQLEALSRVAQLMIERRREAMKILKENEITAVNAERILKELKANGEDITTMTDQTMRNNGGLLEAFLLSFRKNDVNYVDVREELERLKKDYTRCRKELDMLHLRDAECLDAKQEAERLRTRNIKLEKDKSDMEQKMSKMEKNARVHKTQIVEVNIPRKDDDYSGDQAS